MTDSPFSGGGGTPVDPNAPVAPMPKEVSDLMSILNKAATRKYIVDQNGTKLEMEFAANGIVTIKSGDTTMTFPYTRG